MILSRPIRTRFRFGFGQYVLNLASEIDSPDHYAKGTQSPIYDPCGSYIGLLQLASLRFQVLFHSHSWVLFNFPSQYLCTIGCQLVFSLGQWSGRIHTWFLVSGVTWGRYDSDQRI